MRKPMSRMLIRALGLGIALAAVPFAIQFVDGGANNLPALEISEACAQSGGSCVFELYAICDVDGRMDYHMYSPW